MPDDDDSVDLLARFRIYPVRLILPDHEGVTLWGGNLDDGKDFFLTQGEGKVILADSILILADCVQAAGAGPFTSIPEFSPFESHLAEAVRTKIDEEDISEINFRRGREVLRPGVREPGGNGGITLSNIDAIRDLAVQLDEADILRSLRTEGEPLHQLYDYLWGHVDTLDWNRVHIAFDKAVSWFDNKVEKR